jgi:hypothetical protein
MKKIKLLDLVAVKHDLPRFYLKAGDSGTVVEVYDGGLLEVEFVDAEGDTVALLSVFEADVRKLEKDDDAHSPMPLPEGVEAPIGDATATVRP